MDESPYTDEELLELARLNLGSVGRAAKAVTQKAGMELGKVKGYFQMRDGVRTQVRRHVRTTHKPISRDCRTDHR